MLQRLKGPPAPDSSRIVLFDIFTFHTVTFAFFKILLSRSLNPMRSKEKKMILKRTFLGEDKK